MVLRLQNSTWTIQDEKTRVHVMDGKEERAGNEELDTNVVLRNKF